jgi:hypothetical protein
VILELSPGKQVIVNNDPRSTDTWLQLCANKGSLGVSLTPEEAQELGWTLFRMGRRAKRAHTPDSRRMAETENTGSGRSPTSRITSNP